MFSAKWDEEKKQLDGSIDIFIISENTGKDGWCDNTLGRKGGADELPSADVYRFAEPDSEERYHIWRK